MKKAFGLALFITGLSLLNTPNVFAKTFTGTDGPDIITGTIWWDYINGLGGNDYIYAQGGNDEVHGGPGNDYLYGQAGADLLGGEDGNDYLDAGDGIFDQCYGGAGYDVAFNCETYGTDVECFDDDDCGSDSLSRTNDIDIVIGNSNLTKVVGGGGKTIILFNVESELAQNASGNDVLDILVAAGPAEQAVMDTFSPDAAKAMELEGKIMQAGSLSSIRLNALSQADASKIATGLFSKSEKNIIMQSPYDGSDIILRNVDYIGFKNTPLIPVVAQ